MTLRSLDSSTAHHCTPEPAALRGPSTLPANGFQAESEQVQRRGEEPQWWDGRGGGGRRSRCAPRRVPPRHH